MNVFHLSLKFYFARIIKMGEGQQNGHYPVFPSQIVENTNFRAESKDSFHQPCG